MQEGRFTDEENRKAKDAFLDQKERIGSHTLAYICMDIAYELSRRAENESPKYDPEKEKRKATQKSKGSGRKCKQCKHFHASSTYCW